jgi:hypothetical protein
MFAIEKGCLGQSFAKDAWDRACKEMHCWLAFFLLQKFSPKRDIKILKLKNKLFLEAFSCQTKKIDKNHSHLFFFF